MDTNVVLARFAPRDPVHAAARKFFSSSGERIISPVSIVEMNAVLSRESIGLEFPAFLSGETGSRRVRAVGEYFIRFLGLRIESLTLTVRLRVGGVSVGVPLEYSEALKKAAELRLKTLDILHLSYAGLISSLRARIKNFVTSDSSILERKSLIAEKFGLIAIHPKDVTE